MKKKLLFICKKRVDSYGASFGLLNSASFVANALNKKGITSKVVVVEDANAIDREVTRYKPTHVFIQAIWVTAAKFREILSFPRHQCRQWIVRIHSKAPFIANEGIAMEWINLYDELQLEFKNFHISCNSTEFNDSLGRTLNRKSLYLPNIYVPPKYKTTYMSLFDKHADTIDVGCFGAIRPLKNHLNQALAAIVFAESLGYKLRFHVSGNRMEQNGDQVLKNLRALFDDLVHELVEHPWTPHEEFINLINNMDMGMQVSLTESFNIVAADFVSQGVPIVVSPEIDWMPDFYKADPNSVQSMKRALKRARFADAFGFQFFANLKLWFWNFLATRVWMKYLSRC